MHTPASSSALRHRASADPADAPKRFSLTAPQLAIWLDQALHPRKPIYNTGQILTIGTALDVGAFATAVGAAVADFDALRLRFAQHDSDIVQEITPAFDPQLEFKDFSAEDQPEAAASAWIERTFWRALTPSDFPLFRFVLAKTAADRFLWLQKYHHLIIDATGRQLVAARVAAAYNAVVAGHHPPPLEDAGSYASAKEIEDDYRASAQYAIDQAYWSTRLAELPPPVIQTDIRLSEKTRSGRPLRIEEALSDPEVAGLRRLAAERQSSLFKVMLAIAWSCVSRLYARSDLVFGVPLAGRFGSAAKRIVGLFSTVMPFRMRIDPMTTIGEAVSAFDRQFSEDLKHQQLPLVDISRGLRLQRFGRSSLYDLTMNYLRSDYDFDFGGARVACSNLSAGFSAPWNLMILEFKSEVRVILDYDAGRIPADDAQRFMRCFRTLLSAAAALADVPIDRLPMESGVTTPPPTGLAASSASPPDAAAAPCEARQSAPADEIEDALLQIWRSRFEDKAIGVDDDYFELGGDSLKGILVLAECNHRFATDLPLAALFECRTIAKLAEMVRASLRRAAPA